MRRPFSTSFLAALVLLALSIAALASAGGHASASGDQPTVVLHSVEIPLWFGQGPTKRWAEPPTGIYLAYGVAPERRALDLDPAVFDDVLIPPSGLSREFEVEVASSDHAASLASAIAEGLPQGTELVTSERLEGGSRLIGGRDTRTELLAGSEVTHFRLTVPPFTIDEVLQVEPDVQPYYIYQVLPSSNATAATVQVIGTPPHGDANCDAAINSIDALVMLQHGAGLLDTLSCAKAADVNADGTVDARDAQLVLQFSAGLIEEL